MGITILHRILRIAVIATMVMMALPVNAQKTGKVINFSIEETDKGNRRSKPIRYRITELDGTVYEVETRDGRYWIIDAITGEKYAAVLVWNPYYVDGEQQLSYDVMSTREAPFSGVGPNWPPNFHVIGHWESLGKVNDENTLTEEDFRRAIGSTIIGTLITLIGLGGATTGGRKEDEPGKPKEPRPSDPYVEKEPDGTLVYTNPITYEREYFPPDTNEEEIREQVEHVLDNRDYYERIQNQHDRWTNEQREAAQKEIDRRRAEWEKKVAEKQAELDRQRKLQEDEAKRRQERIERLMEEHGAGSEEFLRRNMIRDMGIDEARYWRHMSLSDGIDSAMTATNAVKNAADVGMDICAAVGGKKAEMIRDGYKVATEMTSTITDAIITGKDLKTEIAAGLVRAGITVSQYRTSGKLHVLTTVGGEATRDMINAYKEGKNTWEIFKAGLKGGARGAENAFVDHYTNKLSGVATNKVNNQSGVIGKTATKVTDSDTAKRVIKEIEAAGDDIGKLWGDSFFE